MIIGPYTPPFGFLLHPEIVNLLAPVGIVFLLLAVGLEYPATRFRSVGRKALVIALSEALATFLAGFLVGQALGLPKFDSLFLGLALSVTSTVILAKVLEDLGVIQDQVAGLILGITVIEDIVTVSALGVLQSLATTGTISLVAIGVAVGLVVLFISVALVVGSRTVPRFVDLVARTGRNDLLLLAILGLTLGLCVLSSLIGISVAAGAFVSGVLVAESRNQTRARDLVLPLKELFGAIFFVSIGALMDIELLPAYILPIVALIVTTLTVKLVVTYVSARGQGVPLPAARRTAISLSGPRGELSLVVAKGGADVQATSPFVLPVVGAMTLVTAFLSPYLVRLGWRTGERTPIVREMGQGK